MGTVRVLLALSVVFMHYGAFQTFQLMVGTSVVQGFFIISGFYMALVLSEKYTNAWTFYTARALRLFPAYLVVLALAAVSLPILGRHTYLTSAQFVDELSRGSLLQWFAAVVPNILIVGQDLQLNFCIEGDGLRFVADYRQACRYPAHFNLIPQAWSIALELYFYAVAPLLVRLRNPALIAVAVALLAIRLAIGAAGLDQQIWLYLSFPANAVFFVVGILSYRAYVAFPALVADRRLGVCALAVLVAMFPLDREISAALGSVSAWLFPRGHLLLYVLPILMPFVFALSKNWKWDRKIGELSYTIYIFHFLAYHWTFTLFEGGGKFGYFTSTQAIIAYHALTMAGTIALHVLIEKPLERLRRTATPIINPPERNAVDLIARSAR